MCRLLLLVNIWRPFAATNHMTSFQKESGNLFAMVDLDMNDILLTIMCSGRAPLR
jgi:hypothetical protein